MLTMRIILFPLIVAPFKTLKHGLPFKVVYFDILRIYIIVSQIRNCILYFGDLLPPIKVPAKYKCLQYLKYQKNRNTSFFHIV